MEISRTRSPRPRISWPRIHNKFLPHRANPTSKHPTTTSKYKLQKRAIPPGQQQSSDTTTDPNSETQHQEMFSQQQEMNEHFMWWQHQKESIGRKRKRAANNKIVRISNRQEGAKYQSLLMAAATRAFREEER